MSLSNQSVAVAATATGSPAATSLPAKVWQGVIEVVQARDERSRAQRDALIAFSVRVASAGALYLSQIFLARWMGSHEYGIYVFVWTWVLILGGLSALGLGNGSIRLMAEYRETGEHGLTRGLARGGRGLAFLSGTVVAIVAGLCLYRFGGFLDADHVLPAYLMLLCIPLYAIEHVQDGIGRGRGWIAIALLPPYILRPVMVLLAMVAAHESGLSMTAPTAAAAAVGAVWMTCLVQGTGINILLRRAVNNAKRRYDFRAWLGVSMPLVAVYACELVVQNADVLVISHYMRPTDVAIYFAAAKTMSLIMFVHYAVGSAVAARFSALKARGDEAGLRAFVADAANWTFWPSLAGAAVVLAAGLPLLSLFGPEFAAGYPVMFVLVIGFLLRAAMGPAEILLSMLGEQRICAVLLSLTAVMNVVLNVILVPRYGLLGAAFASAASLSGSALMCYLVARRRLGLDIAIWQNLRRSR